MPMLQVWRCPVCGAESEPSNQPPHDWFTVASQTSVPEVFDSWNCVSTYAQEHQSPPAE